jgi:broad specificity phosphatase PhoE
MIDVYMIRHAESTANLTPDIICGQSSDIDLTALGVEQAYEIGLNLREVGILPDQVYVSPALRAQLTARYCLRAAGINLEPIIDERLHEVSQGHWEGHVRSEKYTRKVQQRAQKKGNDFKAPGGESINDVRKRAFDFLDELVLNYDSKATVFAFGHGFITRAIAAALLGWTHQQTRDHHTPNTSVTLFHHDGKNWSVPFVGRSGFSSELRVIDTIE